MPEFDQETLKKYPMLSCFNEMMEAVLFSEGGETTAGSRISNKRELNEYFRDEYCWRNQTLEEFLADPYESYAKSKYDNCVKALQKGKVIIAKNVSYNDEAIIDLLDRLATPGSGFEIIEREC
jgi:hypothetical protein